MFMFFLCRQIENKYVTTELQNSTVKWRINITKYWQNYDYTVPIIMIFIISMCNWVSDCILFGLHLLF